MIDIDKTQTDCLSEILNPGNRISDEDLNNLHYFFNELLEASLYISYEISKEAEHQDSMKLRIQAEGFDNVIKECHKGINELRKKYNWDSNIGEELQ